MKKYPKEKQVETASPTATLRFSPTAWAKLLYLRDLGETEIGGFAISSSDDLLFVEDVRLVQQACDWAHVEFEDASVADFFDEQVDAGRQPQQFARIWVHTHPGHSPAPSGTDEATFARVFGRSDWALMFILARGGATYARLRCNVGPGVDIPLAVDVCYGHPFAASNYESWREEYLANVRLPPQKPFFRGNDPDAQLPPLARPAAGGSFLEEWWRDAWADYTEFDRYPEEAEYGYVRDF